MMTPKNNTPEIPDISLLEKNMELDLHELNYDYNHNKQSINIIMSSYHYELSKSLYIIKVK